MGSSDSNEQQKQQENKLNVVKDKDVVSKKNTPKHSRKASDEDLKNKNQSLVQSRFFRKKKGKDLQESGEGLPIKKQSNQHEEINIPRQPNAEDNLSPQHQTPESHQTGKINLKVMVLNIQPAFQFKKLNRQFSEHFAELSWEQELRMIEGRKKTFLRYIIKEDGQYYLSFCIDEEGEVIEGDEDIWALVCPFRTTKQTTKVGNYKCERIYESQEQELQEEKQALDSQYFMKWQQKQPVNRPAMMRLLQNRRKHNKMQNQKGFWYRQVSKYFTDNDDWVYSVLVEQKFNCFKSWVIELDSSSEPSSMIVTLKNDIQNRQQMYVEEMLKKKNYKQNIKLSQ